MVYKSFESGFQLVAHVQIIINLILRVVGISMNTQFKILFGEFSMVHSIFIQSNIIPNKGDYNNTHLRLETAQNIERAVPSIDEICIELDRIKTNITFIRY